MSVRTKNITTTPIERCRQNLRREQETAANQLRQSLRDAHGKKRRHDHAFRFDEAYEEDNRKLWEPIRAKWRRSVERALTENLHGILAGSKRLERAAERQGVLTGQLFHQVIEEVFLFSEVTPQREKVALIPPGMGRDGRALYETECEWIVSVLHKLIGPLLSQQSQKAKILPRKSMRLSSYVQHMRAAGLTDKEQECFSLRFERSMSQRRIAAVLNISRATVRERLRNAERKLKK